MDQKLKRVFRFIHISHLMHLHYKKNEKVYIPRTEINMNKVLLSLFFSILYMPFFGASEIWAYLD